MLLGPATSPIALLASNELDLEARLAEHREAGHVTVVAHCEPLGPRRRRPLPKLAADVVLRVPAQSAEPASLRLARLEAALDALCREPDTGLKARIALMEAGAGVASHGTDDDPVKALEAALEEIDVLVSRLVVLVRAPTRVTRAWSERWHAILGSLPRSGRVASAWMIEPEREDFEVVLVAAGFIWSQPHDPSRMVACGGGAPFTAHPIPAPRGGLRLVH